MTEDERRGVWSVESLRIFLQRLIDEKAAAAKEDHNDLKEMVYRDIGSFKELFRQSREDDRQAVEKAETAIEKRLDSVNEFRGQLADQAATLMPRKEAESDIGNLRELMDREMKLLRADIADLREYKSRTSGKIEQGVASTDQNRWVITIAVSLISIAVGVALAIFLRK